MTLSQSLLQSTSVASIHQMKNKPEIRELYNIILPKHPINRSDKYNMIDVIIATEEGVYLYRLIVNTLLLYFYFFIVPSVNGFQLLSINKLLSHLFNSNFFNCSSVFRLSISYSCGLLLFCEVKYLRAFI